jgi:hypothetical protein
MLGGTGAEVIGGPFDIGGSHASNPVGGAYFCEAASGCNVQTPPPELLKDKAANNGPTVTGIKVTKGAVPATGSPLFSQTSFCPIHTFPVKSTANAQTSSNDGLGTVPPPENPERNELA